MVWKPKPEELQFENTGEKCAIMAHGVLSWWCYLRKNLLLSHARDIDDNKKRLRFQYPNLINFNPCYFFNNPVGSFSCYWVCIYTMAMQKFP